MAIRDMQFILASHNPGKVAEMKSVLSPLGIHVLSEEEAGFTLNVEETGSTFEENSYIKANAVCRKSGLPAIADDSGLCVDALGGAPGVYSARYGGECLDDAGRTELLLKNMSGETNRACRFVCVITCCFPDGTVISARGECEGQLTEAPVGADGFGYDPVFYLPSKEKTFAQLNAEEKNAVSHRGAALRLFYKRVKTYLDGYQDDK